MAHLHAAVALQASILTRLRPQAAGAASWVSSILTRMQLGAKNVQWEVPQPTKMELRSVHPASQDECHLGLRWPRANFVLQESTSQLKEALHAQAAAQADLLPRLGLQNVHLAVWAVTNPIQVQPNALLVLLATSTQGMLPLRYARRVLQGALLHLRQVPFAKFVKRAALESPVA